MVASTLASNLVKFKELPARVLLLAMVPFEGAFIVPFVVAFVGTMRVPFEEVASVPFKEAVELEPLIGVAVGNAGGEAVEGLFTEQIPYPRSTV